MSPKLIVRHALREFLGLAGMAVALFWPAGRVDWWPAWASLAVMAAWMLVTAALIFRGNPDLLAERLGPRAGAERWDTAIVSALGLIQLLRYIVAGLDERYGWTESIQPPSHLAATLVPSHEGAEAMPGHAASGGLRRSREDPCGWGPREGGSLAEPDTGIP
jgi:hypothetical protein